MKRRISVLAIAATALLWQACLKEPENEADKYARENEQQIQKFLSDSSLTAERSPLGMYYIKTLQNPSGRQPQTGNQVYVHYEGRRLTDNFLFDQSSRAGNDPLVFALNSGSVITGFNEGVSLLREGERAKLLIPSSLAYGYQRSNTIPAYSALKFDVELVKVLTEDEALRLFATDSLKFDPPKLEAVTNAPGTYYVKLHEGPGVNIENGKKVSIKIGGHYVDGSEFVKAGSAYNFTMGEGTTIKGLEEAVRRMKVGEKGVVFIPSSQGYGEKGLVDRGVQVIAPYTPLIYNVEVVSAQ